MLITQCTMHNAQCTSNVQSTSVLILILAVTLSVLLL